MNSSNKSLYYQWFGIGVVITFACVAFGLYLTQFLSKRKEDFHRQEMRKQQKNQIFGPVKNKLEIMRFLIESGKATPEEAFKIVDKTHQAPFPEATFLLNEKGDVLAKHFSKFYDPKSKIEPIDYPLSKHRRLRVIIDHPRYFLGPGPGHRFGPPRHTPPLHGPKNFRLPPDVILVVLVAIGFSIIIGIGLSVIALTLYLRKRAKHVSEIMNKITTGDLSARFEISQTGESGQLMVKFNQMAGEIETLVRNLKSSEESRKNLLQELAHDLRTPVASLRNLQETLFQKSQMLSTEETSLFQSLAQKEVNYFERLVEDLLFLSGVNDPRYKQTTKDIDLEDLILDELDKYELKNLQKDLKLQGPLLTIGDEHLLQRLFRNAFSNARRFAKTKLSVSGEVIDGSIIIKIRDDGPGMNEKDLEAFGEKKYSRQIRDDESDHISLGLGSVIMKKIMFLHRGELSVRNATPGIELTFKFPKI